MPRHAHRARPLPPVLPAAQTSTLWLLYSQEPCMDVSGGSHGDMGPLEEDTRELEGVWLQCVWLWAALRKACGQHHRLTNHPTLGVILAA